MADYYPLIARAVAGLDPSATGEARRALYDRARTALIAQLRGVQPPLGEAEITRERLALEEAVRKVEAEAAQRSRGDAPRPDPTRARPAEPQSPAPRRGDILREGARAAASRTAPPSNGAPRPQRPQEPRYTEQPQQAPRAPTRPRDEFDHDDRPPPRDARPAERPQAQPPQRRPQDAGRAAPQSEGTRGFRDVVADTNDLGRAASQANRSARRTYANVASPSPEFERTEPDMEQRSGYVPYSYDESLDEAGDYQPGPRKRGRAEKAPIEKRRGFPLKGALALGLALILIGGGILGYQKLSPSLRGLFKSSPATDSQSASDAGSRPKITDRVGQTDSSQPIAPIAQRAILFEEDPNDPQGKQTVGTVVWRLDQIAPSPGQKPDTAVRADIDLPDRKIKVALTFMRNTDASMPATSHTMEIVYTLAPDFGTTISNVPGIYAKSPDQPRGTPLAATSVKVQDGYFLIGLSNVDVDRARNIQVLKERSSLDIPMVYGNQKRAILSIEKGPPGERAINDAFSAWGQ